MDDPVVVNPEVDSKKALMNEGIVPLIIYGRQPAREMTIHDNVTDRKLSRIFIEISFSFLEIR